MNRRNELKERIKRLAKKGLTFSLCAVLAGGMAFGTAHGIEAVTGLTTLTTVSAADPDFTLLKASDKKDEEKESSDEKTRGSLDVSDIAEKAMPSVVSITTKSIEEIQDYYGYYFGFGGYAPQQKEVEGSGSGIILAQNNDELLIATNYHVVEGATTLSVTFIDNETYSAKTKGFDPDKDLAVVSVPISELSKDTQDAITAATIGSSDDLRVGEQVVAIGNAMGYGQSVTTGIVSAKNRRINANAAAYSTSSDDGVNLIQTDAAINPGNSGGALLNMDGEVVGINSAKLASTEVEGMGYSIAISDVSDILVDLMNATTRDKIESGKHGVLGIVGQSVGSEMAQMYDVPEGVFVAEITEGGGAEKAGMKTKSIITKFDGRRVRTIDELVELLLCYEPGEEIDVTVQVMGEDGYQEQIYTITLGESEEAVEDTAPAEDAIPDENADSSDENEEAYDEEYGDFGEDFSQDPYRSFEERIPDFSQFFR